MRELGRQQLVAEVVTQLITREVADLTSPGGSRPMRRSYEYQPTPPAQWFGQQRANHVHDQNAVKRAICDALFKDARENKKRYASRRRDKARREKNVLETGLARRVCESKAARTQRDAQPRSRSRASPLPAVTPAMEMRGLPPYACLRMAVDMEDRFMCAGLPVALAQECDAAE